MPYTRQIRVDASWICKSNDFKNKCETARKKLIESIQNPAKSQLMVFNDVVNFSKNTAYWAYFNPKNVNNIESIKEQFPIVNYDVLTPWIDKQAKSGNQDKILTNDLILRWLKTSGTTSLPKKIPYTRHWMRFYRAPSLYAQWGCYIKYFPNMLDTPFSILDLSVSREYPEDEINRIPYQAITNRTYCIDDYDWKQPWYDMPWFTPDIPNEYATRMYYRLRYFLGKNLRSIVSINPSTLLSLKFYLTEFWPKLYNDIKNGTLMGEKIDEEDPETARNLDNIVMSNNFNFNDIWPNLSLLVCWCTASAKFYTEDLQLLFPRSKVMPFMTVGTEGVVTIPIDDDKDSQPLSVNQGIYEFIPVRNNEWGSLFNQKYADTLSFDNLEIGENYYLIMSQPNGFLRYVTGDVYTVVGYQNSIPRLAFSGRHGVYNSFTGEKLTESQILSVMNKVFSSHNLLSNLFFCFPKWDKVPYYIFVLELDVSNMNEFQLTKTIDAELSKCNGEYLSKRKTNRLGKPRCFAVAKGKISQFQEKKIKKMSGGPTYQVKYTPFQKDEELLKELIGFCHEIA